MEVVVPFATDAPKTRLEPVLSPSEREAFATAMLEDVLAAVTAAGHEPGVLATGPLDVDVPVVEDDRPLSEAVNTRLDAHFGRESDDGRRDTSERVSDDERRDKSESNRSVRRPTDTGIAVVMADLAIVTPDAIDRLCEAPGDLVLAPGRYGGTNALVARDPEFRVDYHGTSYLDHREIADDLGLDVTVVDSFRLASDVDEPHDLVEVLCHGEGRSRAFLREAGFSLSTTGGRVAIERR